MRFLRRSLLGLMLLAVTLGVIGYAAGGVQEALRERAEREGGSRPARERVFAVNTLTISPEQITPVLEVFGEVQSRRALDLRSATGGEVIELSPNFVEGGRVTAGEVLLQIDRSDAQTAVSLAQADLAEAQGDLRDADLSLTLSRDELAAAQSQVALQERALARQQDLVARGVGTEAALEGAELSAASAKQAVLSRRQSIQSAEARLSQAQLRLDRLQISLAEAERHLAETTLTAGFDGTLADVTLVQGGIVSANERLAQLVDPTALEIAVRVSTQQYLRLLDDEGRLRNADVIARIDVFGVDLEATGQISRESAAVGEGQTGRLLFVRLDEARGFRPGDFVSVEIAEEPIGGVIRAPAASLSAANRILVLGDEDRLEEVDVDLLRRQGDDVLFRARGLRDRDMVAERSPLLGAGIKVRKLAPAGTPIPETPQMVALTDERRAKIVAFIEGNQRMPAEAKARVLSQLEQPEVPAAMVERIEGRMGG